MPQQNNSSRQYSGFCQIISMILLGLGLAATQYSYALPSDRQQPISIDADSSSMNANSKTGLIRGNVVITQGTLKLNADTVSSSANQKGETTLITIQGSPAKFQQQTDTKNGLAKGEAKTITYNIETGILTLSGNAYLYQNGASFRGENLRYSMNKGDIQADGGTKGRIQIIIPPSAQQSFSGVKD